MKNVLLILLLLIAPPVYAGCSADSDCKGDRICERGKCVSPEGEVERGTSGSAPQQNYSRPSRDIASVCVTNFGTCSMAQAISQGSPCYCPTMYGPIGGISR